MTESLLWLLICVALLSLLGSGVILWLSYRLVRSSLQAQEPVQLKQLELIDKMTTLVASKDVLAFQGIQAMQAQVNEYAGYDPSDEGEAQRIAHEHQQRRRRREQQPPRNPDRGVGDP